MIRISQLGCPKYLLNTLLFSTKPMPSCFLSFGSLGNINFCRILITAENNLVKCIWKYLFVPGILADASICEFYYIWKYSSHDNSWWCNDVWETPFLRIHGKRQVVMMPTFVFTGCTKGCHDDNLWCCQWRQSWHHDDLILHVSEFFIPNLFIPSMSPQLSVMLLQYLCPYC